MTDIMTHSWTPEGVDGTSGGISSDTPPWASEVVPSVQKDTAKILYSPDAEFRQQADAWIGPEGEHYAFKGTKYTDIEFMD